MFFNHVFALSCLLHYINCQVFSSSDLNLYTTPQADGKTMAFRMEIAPSYQTQGWVGFGLGSSMSNAEVYVVFMQAGNIVLTRRKASGHIEPAVIASDFNIVQDQSGFIDNVLVVTFTRTLAKFDASGMTIQSGTQTLSMHQILKKPPKRILFLSTRNLGRTLEICFRP